jgi:hypothetical protein
MHLFFGSGALSFPRKECTFSLEVVHFLSLGKNAPFLWKWCTFFPSERMHLFFGSGALFTPEMVHLSPSEKCRVSLETAALIPPETEHMFLWKQCTFVCK